MKIVAVISLKRLQTGRFRKTPVTEFLCTREYIEIFPPHGKGKTFNLQDEVKRKILCTNVPQRLILVFF